MRSSLPFAEEPPPLTAWEITVRLTRLFIGWTVAFGSVIAVGYMLH